MTACKVGFEWVEGIEEGKGNWQVDQLRITSNARKKDPAMNLGRREFLKFVTAAIAGIQVKSSSEIYQSPTFYADKKLGFAFEIP